MSFASQYIDAMLTLLVGLVASHLGWYHPALSSPPHKAHAAYWRAERCIGPLLIALAVVELALVPGCR
jgi:hypothetical protein